MTDEELFELVKNAYSETNKDYLEKQLKIASEHLTEEQKKELLQKRVYPFKFSSLNGHLVKQNEKFSLTYCGANIRLL